MTDVSICLVTYTSAPQDRIQPGVACHSQGCVQFSTGSSVKRRIAELLASQTLPFIYTAGYLVAELDLDPGVEYKRRHRELRDLGWVILTYRELRGLATREYLLTKVGEMPK
jgi:hypothetical protein